MAAEEKKDLLGLCEAGADNRATLWNKEIIEWKKSVTERHQEVQRVEKKKKTGF